MTDPADALARDIILSAAADHARDGDYAKALRELDQVDAADPVVLDLRARIQAQRGDLVASDQAWARVLLVVPDDRDALAGRRLIAEISAGRRNKRPVLPLALICGCVLAAVVTVGVAVALPEPQEAVSVSSQAGTQRQPSTGIPERANDMATEQAQQQADDERRRGRLAILVGNLRGPEVQVAQRDHDVRVIFDEGLFLPDEAALTAEGRRTLGSWAQRLRGMPVTITVFGHGVVVPGSPSTGGSTIALSRAVSAAKELSTISGLPLSAFMTATAEQSAEPHPGSGPTTQSRNRTISLLIRPNDM